MAVQAGSPPPFLLRPHRDMQHFQEVRYGNIRKCLWLTLENPGYSIPSKLFSLVSIGVVLTSIATMCINSIPEYQVGTTEKFKSRLNSVQLFQSQRQAVTKLSQATSQHLLGAYRSSRCLACQPSLLLILLLTNRQKWTENRIL